MSLKNQNVLFGGLLFFLASETILAIVASTFSEHDKTLLLYAIPATIAALTFFWVIILWIASNRPEYGFLYAAKPSIISMTFAASSFIWSILTPLIATQSPYGCEDTDADYNPTQQMCAVPVSSAVMAWMIWALVTVGAVLSRQGVPQPEPKAADDKSERASSVTFPNA